MTCSGIKPEKRSQIAVRFASPSPTRRQSHRRSRSHSNSPAQTHSHVSVTESQSVADNNSAEKVTRQSIDADFDDPFALVLNDPLLSLTSISSVHEHDIGLDDDSGSTKQRDGPSREFQLPNRQPSTQDAYQEASSLNFILDDHFSSAEPSVLQPVQGTENTTPISHSPSTQQLPLRHRLVSNKGVDRGEVSNFPPQSSISYDPRLFDLLQNSGSLDNLPQPSKRSPNGAAATLASPVSVSEAWSPLPSQDAPMASNAVLAYDSPTSQTYRQPSPTKSPERRTASSSQLPKAISKRSTSLSAIQRRKSSMMRKQGACIRCRMLRKSCSVGNPCTECEKVSQPRVWSMSCRRVKLIDEKAAFDTDRNGRSVFNHFRTIGLGGDITGLAQNCLKVSIGSELNTMMLRIVSPQLHCDDGEGQTGGRLVIDWGEHSIASDQIDQIEDYLVDETVQLSTFEQSPLIANTVYLAQALSEAKHDELLTQTVQLWAATLILVDDSVPFIFSRRPQVDDVSRVVDNDVVPTEGVWKRQIRAALEQIVRDQVTKILPKLEYRICRPLDLEFETYLAAVLVLNSAERLCWVNGIPLGSESPLVAQEEQSTLVEKGESLAESIQLMLNIRGLSPRTFSGHDGVLAVALEASQDQRHWLQQLSITEGDVQTMMSRTPTGEDCRSLDGRLWARTLLPDL